MLILSLADRLHKVPAEIEALPYEAIVELLAYCHIQATETD